MRWSALRHLDVGADGEFRRLPQSRGNDLGPPDRRADEALTVGIGGVLVQHHFLRDGGRLLSTAYVGMIVGMAPAVATTYTYVGEGYTFDVDPTI